MLPSLHQLRQQPTTATGTAGARKYINDGKKQKTLAPTTPSEVVGTVVEFEGDPGTYFLEDENGKYWWFDNVQVIEAYPTLRGPNKQVLDLNGGFVELSISPFWDYVVDGDYYNRVEPKPHLKAQVGERVSFVPRETSTLRLENDKLIILNWPEVNAQITTMFVPGGCAGVATNTRPAK